MLGVPGEGIRDGMPVLSLQCIQQSLFNHIEWSGQQRQASDLSSQRLVPTVQIAVDSGIINNPALNPKKMRMEELADQVDSEFRRTVSGLTLA